MDAVSSHSPPQPEQEAHDDAPDPSEDDSPSDDAASPSSSHSRRALPPSDALLLCDAVESFLHSSSSPGDVWAHCATVLAQRGATRRSSASIATLMQRNAYNVNVDGALPRRRDDLPLEVKLRMRRVYCAWREFKSSDDSSRWVEHALRALDGFLDRVEEQMATSTAMCTLQAPEDAWQECVNAVAAVAGEDARDRTASGVKRLIMTLCKYPKKSAMHARARELVTRWDMYAEAHVRAVADGGTEEGEQARDEMEHGGLAEMDAATAGQLSDTRLRASTSRKAAASRGMQQTEAADHGSRCSWNEEQYGTVLDALEAFLSSASDQLASGATDGLPTPETAWDECVDALVRDGVFHTSTATRARLYFIETGDSRIRFESATRARAIKVMQQLREYAVNYATRTGEARSSLTNDNVASEAGHGSSARHSRNRQRILWTAEQVTLALDTLDAFCRSASVLLHESSTVDGLMHPDAAWEQCSNALCQQGKPHSAQATFFRLKQLANGEPSFSDDVRRRADVSMRLWREYEHAYNERADSNDTDECERPSAARAFAKWSTHEHSILSFAMNTFLSRSEASLAEGNASGVLSEPDSIFDDCKAALDADDGCASRTIVAIRQRVATNAAFAGLRVRLRKYRLAYRQAMSGEAEDSFSHDDRVESQVSTPLLALPAKRSREEGQSDVPERSSSRRRRRSRVWTPTNPHTRRLKRRVVQHPQDAEGDEEDVMEGEDGQQAEEEAEEEERRPTSSSWHPPAATSAAASPCTTSMPSVWLSLIDDTMQGVHRSPQRRGGQPALMAPRLPADPTVRAAGITAARQHVNALRREMEVLLVAAECSPSAAASLPVELACDTVVRFTALLAHSSTTAGRSVEGECLDASARVRDQLEALSAAPTTPALSQLQRVKQDVDALARLLARVEWEASTAVAVAPTAAAAVGLRS